MTLSPEQKDHAVELIEMGDKLEAVRYLQETLTITADQALLLAEKLEEETESDLEKEFKSMQDEIHKKPPVNVGRLVGGVFMCLGVIMLAIAAYSIASNYKFSERAITVKGKVIDYDSYESRNDDGRSTTMYTPTFEYSFKGKIYTHKSTTSSSSKDYKIDEAVNVLVDPDKPTEILIDSFWERWFVSVLLGFLGIMFTGMGYLAYRVFGKQI
ncbi:MAG: DUF3592 domain-containing protein [Cyclobacteriaceae bacterium]|nr:DUF3592 domain-containing protein [Cyclobacteriaceae bacterium]